MTKREQGLGLMFVGLLFAGGAFVGLTQLKAWKQRVDQRAYNLDSRLLEAKDLLREKEKWEQRSAWLAEKQPEYTKRSEADLTTLSLVRDTAANNGVTIDNQQNQEPTERLGLTSSTWVFQGKGDLASVLKWLHAIQDPTSFISIPAVTITPNEEDTSQVIVNVTVQKWFRLPPA
jgi:hypothetical protein